MACITVTNLGVLFIWPNGFRGEYFLEIDQSETRIACRGHVG
jgi:hypothetical protein